MTTFAVPRSRTPSVERHPTPVAPDDGDSGLSVIGVLLWLSGLLRVVLAFQNHEVFGLEATLALATVLILPWLCFVSLLAKFRRTR
jgi:hypothetical protein